MAGNFSGTNVDSSYSCKLDYSEVQCLLFIKKKLGKF